MSNQTISDALEAWAADLEAGRQVWIPAQSLRKVAAELRRLHAEVNRLTACLAKANSQAEHFEREWYLRGDEIEKLRQGGEAVAWRVTPRYEDSDGYFDFTGEKETADELRRRGWNVTDLYTSPPLQADAVAWLRTSGTGSPVCTEEFLKAHPEYRHEYEQPLVKLTQADACKVPQEVIDFLDKREHDSYSCGLLVKDLRQLLSQFPLRDFNEVPNSFLEWMRREMPAGTEIGDPDWWAPRIFRAMLAAPTQVETQGDKAYIAGLESGAGHLSALVDDLRRLMARAMAEMKALEESAKPVNEPRGDFDALIPYDKWSNFVDGRARLLHDLHHGPHELPAAPSTPPIKP